MCYSECMNRFKCQIHSVLVTIPDTDDEFLNGRYHQDVELCKIHHENFPECIFEEVHES